MADVGRPLSIWYILEHFKPTPVLVIKGSRPLPFQMPETDTPSVTNKQNGSKT